MNRKTRAGFELTVGVLLVFGVIVAGIYFSARPGPTVVDGWVFAAIPAGHHSGLLLAVTRLGSPFVVVAAAVVGMLVTLGRNRARALALLVGPVLAVTVCEWAVKPVVGRTFADVVSFPSGTVTAIASLAAVGLLATPDPWRLVMAAFGGTVTVLAVVSVVALRWHFPTDAVAGAALGVGVVLLTDCAARALAGRVLAGRAGSGRPDAERAVTH
ncbi:MAG TPA: phosphatase PAP2 family protein [Acidimicrobiales bacterium]|nr:phosphatase PAP2 family protein [Acidimicrobiales bacterium]